MKTTMHKMQHGEWKVAVGGFVVGVVERSSRAVRHPTGKMVRVGTWVALRRMGTSARRRVGGHASTRREAVYLLVQASVSTGEAP